MITRNTPARESRSARAPPARVRIRARAGVRARARLRVRIRVRVRVRVRVKVRVIPLRLRARWREALTREPYRAPNTPPALLTLPLPLTCEPGGARRGVPCALSARSAAYSWG